MKFRCSVLLPFEDHEVRPRASCLEFRRPWFAAVCAAPAQRITFHLPDAQHRLAHRWSVDTRGINRQEPTFLGELVATFPETATIAIRGHDLLHGDGQFTDGSSPRSRFLITHHRALPGAEQLLPPGGIIRVSRSESANDRHKKKSWPGREKVRVHHALMLAQER